MTVEADHNPSGLLGAVITKWLSVPADEVGQVIYIPNHSDKTLNVWGTFGGATAVLQGTNDDRAITDVENADWKTLDDHKGNSCSYTSAQTYLAVVYPNPTYIRVKVTGGNGTTSLNFSITSKRG